MKTQLLITQSQSAAARMVGNTALVHMTVMYKCGEMVAHATFLPNNG